MIELLPDMPKGVTGVRVSGRLRGDEKPWVAHTVHALAWMIPGELAVFKLDELDRAKEWAAG